MTLLLQLVSGPLEQRRRRLHRQSTRRRGLREGFEALDFERRTFQVRRSLFSGLKVKP
jgi:hypothetical protein